MRRSELTDDRPLCRACGGDGISPYVHPRMESIIRLPVTVPSAAGFGADPPRRLARVGPENPLVLHIYRYRSSIAKRGLPYELDYSLSEACQSCYGHGRVPMARA